MRYRTTHNREGLFTARTEEIDDAVK